MFEFNFNKVADLKSCKFIKKRLQHKTFAKSEGLDGFDSLMKKKANNWAVGLVLLNGLIHVSIIDLKDKS